MAYGTVKVDNITFTNGGIDQTVTVSGIVQSISGNITATGTIQGQTIIGTSTVSGATVTGDAGQFTTATAATGIFTSQISGATITGNVGSFTTITGGTVTLTSGVFASGTAAAPSVSIGTTDNGLYSPGADQVAVATNGTGRLFVDASGNVGVGTSSVNALLEVNNSTAGGEVQRIEGNYDGSGSVTLTNWRRAGGSVAAALKYNDDSSPLCMSIGTTTSHEFRIRTADTDAITIDTSQRVGIGTSSPTTTLHVVGSSGSGAIQIGNAVNTQYHYINFGGSASTNDAWQLGRSPSGGIGPTNGFYLYDLKSSATRLAVDTSGNVGIGTTTPNSNGLVTIYEGSGGKLYLSDGQLGLTYGARLTGGGIGGEGAYAELGVVDNNTYNKAITVTAQANQIVFGKGATEKARIDLSGRLLVGTSTARTTGWTTQGAGEIFQELTNYGGITCFTNSTNEEGTYFTLGKSRGTAVGSNTIVQNNDRLGGINFQGADGSASISAASIHAFVDGTPGANDMPGRLVFSTTADGASSPTERMRITSGGDFLFGKTTNVATDNGAIIGALGQSFSVASQGFQGSGFHRNGDDGGIIGFFQDGTQEGSISVSGGTVSYNGAHLSRWSQLASGAERIEILRGSVLSNLDEMCEWGEEENEQLNRMKVSDVEGDKNVSGVFQAWDDDDDTYTNDFYCAMTGDFIIRIAEGVTVERGDLLMSAGDGTAKPQDDDIIRSKTIAKVTSTNVSCTYEDGSYCVPCVLMAC
jgi:hypothetical protein